MSSDNVSIYTGTSAEFMCRGYEVIDGNTVEVRGLHTLRLESLKIFFQPRHKFLVNKL